MSSKKTVLETINEYSIELYYLVKSRKIQKKYLYQAVLSKDKEAILSKMLPVSKRRMQSLQSMYTKKDCLDEILFLTDTRYQHLKEIRNIVNLESFVELVISDKIYLEKLRIHYTDFIVDLLVEDFYDYQSLKLFSKMKKKIIQLDHNTNRKIMANIDKFYIQKITI